MRSGGWKPFWAALFASLLVLVPLVGGTVLLSRQQLRTQLRQAARSESGVPIQLPKTTDQLTVLLCVSGEQPGFVLAYLNASQNCVHLLGVPAVLTVPFADEQAALAQCYAAAGPARCREALMQVLALPEDTRYLAFSPDVLERIASRYGPVRVGFTGALTEEELARYGRSRAVQGIFRRGRARILVPAAGRRSLFTSTHRSGPRCRVGCVSPAGSGPAARHPAGCPACQQFGPAHRPDRAGL